MPEFKEVSKIILHHHERYDGKGYPNGLKGIEIPLISRIVAVADTFDAMTSLRSYRSKFTPEKSINEIKLNAGFQFDPQVVKGFCLMINSTYKNLFKLLTS